MGKVLADFILEGHFADLPTDNSAGTTGRLYFTDDSGQIFRDNGTTWDDRTPSGGGGGSSVIYRETTGDAVSNTSAPTALIETGIGSVIIPANTLQAGDIIRIHFGAFGGSKASSSGDITLAFLMNATAVALLGPSAMVDGNAGAWISMEADLLFQTIGASAVIRGSVRVYCELFAAPSVIFWWGSTLDTTIDQGIDIQVTFSVADVANSLDNTSGITYIERL